MTAYTAKRHTQKTQKNGHQLKARFDVDEAIAEGK